MFMVLRGGANSVVIQKKATRLPVTIMLVAMHGVLKTEHDRQLVVISLRRLIQSSGIFDILNRPIAVNCEVYITPITL